jgi:hypothetical protein
VAWHSAACGTGPAPHPDLLPAIPGSSPGREKGLWAPREPPTGSSTASAGPPGLGESRSRRLSKRRHRRPTERSRTSTACNGGPKRPSIFLPFASISGVDSRFINGLWAGGTEKNSFFPPSSGRRPALASTIPKTSIAFPAMLEAPEPLCWRMVIHASCGPSFARRAETTLGTYHEQKQLEREICGCWRPVTSKGRAAAFEAGPSSSRARSRPPDRGDAA